MKRTIQITALAAAWVLLASSIQPDKLAISITDKENTFIPNINNVQFGNALTLDALEKVLGKPDRIIKQRKGKKRCGGLGGHCGTKIPIPKRRFIFYDKLGLELIGENVNDIFAIKIYFDTTGLETAVKGNFSGQLTINGIKIDAKSGLTSLETIEKSKLIDVLGDDPIECGEKCRVFDTTFRPGFSMNWLGIYELLSIQKSSKISLTYNAKREITCVTYYKP